MAGRKDAPLVALYVYDLSMNPEKLARLLFTHQLPVQPVPVPPALLAVNIERVAPVVHHVRFKWSVYIRPAIGLSTAHIVDRLGKRSPVVFCLVVSWSSTLQGFPVVMPLFGQTFPLHATQPDFCDDLRMTSVDMANVVHRVGFNVPPSVVQLAQVHSLSDSRS